MGEIVELDASGIRSALSEVARRLAAAGQRGSLVVAGGAALVLLYNARKSTKDVDVYISEPEPASLLRDVAVAVGEALGLPSDWLNDGCKGYFHGYAPGEVVFSEPGLVVQAAAPHQLLAMKLSAWRDTTDFSDARFLLGKISGDKEYVWRIVEPFIIPGREIRARYAFEETWELVRENAS